MKITPEALREAYVTKGIVPIQTAFNITVGPDGKFTLRNPETFQLRCCAITAMLAGVECPEYLRTDAELAGAEVDAITAARALLELSDPWEFVRGFDQGDYSDHWTTEQAEKSSEYALGRACWRAVEDLAPPKGRL